MTLVGTELIVGVQGPLVLSEDTLVEPDIAVLRLREAGTPGPRPVAAMALLVVEVSDSSLSFDMQTTLPLYARAGIPGYWIVDVRRTRVHVYSEPAELTYGRARLYAADQLIDSATLSNIAVDAREIFSRS